VSEPRRLLRLLNNKQILVAEVVSDEAAETLADHATMAMVSGVSLGLGVLRPGQGPSGKEVTACDEATKFLLS
jgi:hypothetical protein